MPVSPGRKGLMALTLIAFTALLGAYARPATAQTFAAQDLTNSYLTANMGWADQLNGENVAGRIYIIDNTAKDLSGNTLPDYLLELPYTTDVGTKTMGAFITVRIDGGWPLLAGTGVGGVPPQADTAGTTGGWDLIFGDEGVFGKTDQSAWSRPPFVNGNVLIAQWTTLPGSVTTHPIPSIQVDSQMMLIHDMLRVRLTVTNKDTQAHSVGLRWAQPYNLPGQDLTSFVWGPVYLNNGTAVSTDTDVRGSQVPASWRQVLPGNPNSVGSVLTPINPPIGTPSPDRWAIGFGNTISDDATLNNLWDKIPSTVPGYDFSKPGSLVTAAATYFEPRQYSPGQSRTFTFYFGRNHATIDFNEPWAAGVDGPLSVDYDPSKPVGQQLTPNPVKVQAFVQNLGQLPLSNVTGVLNLPQGLSLSSGETSSKTVATVGAGAEAAFSWNVVPDGTASGKLTYSVSFTATPGSQGKVVTRTIDIPALPTQTLPGGLQMVSFPYTFDDPTPSAALGLSDLDFALLEWNQQPGAYQAVQLIQPGSGYWLNLADQKTVNLQNAHPVTATGNRFEIQLKKGWNMVGNPWLTKVFSSDIAVVTTDVGDPNYLQPLTIEQAADGAHQWIAPVFWTYDLSQTPPQYTPDLDFTNGLTPFVGYWLDVLKPNISLLITKPAQARAVPVARQTPSAPGSWKLKIVASTSGSEDGWNYLGVAPSASDGWDVNDLAKPPAIQGHVSVGFTHPEWAATRAAVYAQDLRSTAASRKTWNLVVTTPKPNTDVTVSWPGIGSVPRSYELYITDRATGQRQALRQTSSLHVNTGSAASRAFQITAEPRGFGALKITGLRVLAHRGGSAATISFGTTQDATVQVRVLGATGSTIRGLSTRAATAGQSQVNWDLKDGKGISVPTGAYTIVVTATASDGTQARQIVPFLVTR